jgi:hypothetical protein
VWVLYLPHALLITPSLRSSLSSFCHTSLISLSPPLSFLPCLSLSFFRFLRAPFYPRCLPAQHARLLLSNGRLVGAANHLPRRLVLRAWFDQPAAAVVRGRLLLPAGRVSGDRFGPLRSRRLLPAGRVFARRLGRVSTILLLRYHYLLLMKNLMRTW